MAYQNYPIYQNVYPPAYQDRLAQLQNQYQQTMPQIPTPQPQVNQGLLWVSGEIGAKSYLVAPNTTVLLMDSEGQRFYLKSTDGAGMPSLRIFEYNEVTANNPQNTHPIVENLDNKYVTREEFDGFNKQISEQYKSILDKLENHKNSLIPEKKVMLPKVKEVESNE